jgi:hypothetical protein
MTQPQVADEGDGFQIWRAAVSILNKQLWTVDKEWQGLGVSLKTLHHRKISLLQNVTKVLKPGQTIWINDITN